MVNECYDCGKLVVGTEPRKCSDCMENDKDKCDICGEMRIISGMKVRGSLAIMHKTDMVGACEPCSDFIAFSDEHLLQLTIEERLLRVERLLFKKGIN